MSSPYWAWRLLSPRQERAFARPHLEWNTEGVHSAHATISSGSGSLCDSCIWILKTARCEASDPDAQAALNLAGTERGLRQARRRAGSAVQSAGATGAA